MTRAPASSQATSAAAADADAARVAHHSALIATYQQGLARAGGDRSAVDEPGRAALAALVEDLDGLLREIIADKATSRFGAAWPHGLFEEARAEMIAVIVDAAGRFDPVRCPAFHSWVTGSKGEARLAMYGVFDALANTVGGLDKRQRRALGIARKAAAALRLELGREPNTAELQEAMWDHCYAYQFERLSPAEQALPQQEWRRIARAKLVNNSMRKHIAEIESLRAADSRPVSPEDFATGWDHLEACRPAGERPEDAPGVLEEHEASELAQVAFGGLAATDRQIVAARLGAVEADAESSLTAVASRFRVPVAHVKTLVATATARMQAAHAHYAFLAPGLDAQFESAPSAAGPAAAGILARLQPALA